MSNVRYVNTIKVALFKVALFKMTSDPVPAAEKHPHSMMLPPSCITVGIRGRPIMIFQSRYRLLEDPKKPIPINRTIFIYLFVIMTITTILNEHLF